MLFSADSKPGDLFADWCGTVICGSRSKVMRVTHVWRRVHTNDQDLMCISGQQYTGQIILHPCWWWRGWVAVGIVPCSTSSATIAPFWSSWFSALVMMERLLLLHHFIPFLFHIHTWNRLLLFILMMSLPFLYCLTVSRELKYLQMKCSQHSSTNLHVHLSPLLHIYFIYYQILH